MAKFTKGCNNLLRILVISNLILMTYQNGNLQKNKLARNLEAESTMISELPSTYSTDLSDIFSTDI